MKPSANVTFIFASSAPELTLCQDAMIGKKLGRLVLEYFGPEAVSRYDLIDCFDQSIRKSKRLLLRTNKSLKLLLPDGCHMRQPCSENMGFVADLPEGAVKAQLAGISPLRTLLIVGRGTISSWEVVALDRNRKTHARAYFQSFQAEGGNKSVTLVTVKGLRGYDKAFDALTALIGRLRYKDGLKQDVASLYRQLIPDYHDYNPKPDIVITREESSFQAANNIISLYMAIARHNEPGIIADYDSEFLHDYRVSLRKVRSVVSLFKGTYSDEQTQDLKQAFAKLMEPTGRLRDLDVYLLDRQHYFDLLPGVLHDGLTIMFKMFAEERSKQHKVIAAHFKRSAYHDSISQLANLFSHSDGLQRGPNALQPAYNYACDLIWKRYRKIGKIARAIDDDTNDEDVHELRIHCKKLRYLMEFFSPLFDSKHIKRLLKPLRRLQDNLGLFNDYSVQQEFIKDFTDSHRPKNKEQKFMVAKTAGALIAVLYQRQMEERDKVVRSFIEFDSETIQVLFRKLFQHCGK